MKKSQPGFLHRHSLSLVTALVLIVWTVLYIFSNEQTHWGSFFGNAIADWTGLLVAVLATKFLYEKGSAESKTINREPMNRFLRDVLEHSLTIFLVVTGIAWIVLFAKMDPNSKWGQVVGNIVSEWTQLAGTVVLTKKFLERGSKESK
jgi:membrane protease YdiL (CAAX protease family)